MIKINDTELPSPKTYQVGIQDINKAERNALGDLIASRITTKRKIEMDWGILTQTEMSLILNLTKDIFFEVEYFDPQEGDYKTGTFYAGDRVAPFVTFKNGQPRYNGLKFNIIER